MTNFWEEKIEFWRNKTTENKLYEGAHQEISADLHRLIELYNIKRIIDVGGYQGEMKQRLPRDIRYHNLDFVTKFDLSKDWESQGLALGDPEVTVCFTSLVMISVPPEVFEHIKNEMRKFSRFILHYEQVPIPGMKSGQQIDPHYGGKWNYYPVDYVEECEGYTIEDSRTNKSWHKIEIDLRSRIL